MVGEGAIIAPFPLLWILHWSGLSSLEQLKLLCGSKDAVFTVKIWDTFG